MLIIPKNGQTWVICGGRDFHDWEMFNAAMSDLCQLRGCPERIVHGHATGADALAHRWAAKMALTVGGYAAEWAKHGRAAGPMRNQKMLDDFKPDLVVAFPGGRGTADMMRRAKRADVDVAEIRLT